LRGDIDRIGFDLEQLESRSPTEAKLQR
jgi:hypothetical protein